MSDTNLRTGTHFGWVRWMGVFSDYHRKCLQTRLEPARTLQIFRQFNFSTDNLEHGMHQPATTWLTDPAFELDDVTYARMKPALWLATRFVRASREFFDSVWYLDEVTEDGVLCLDHANQPNTAIYDNWLDDVARNISNFQIFLGYHKGTDKAYALHTNVNAETRASEQMKRTWVMQLNSKFLEFYTDPTYDAFSKEIVERTHFVLAVTLAHEFVHTCHSMKFQKHQQEPFYYKSDPDAELGRAWERWAFAGFPALDAEIDFVNSTGLGVFNVEDIWHSGDRPPALRATVLNDLEVADFFDSDCWEILSDLTHKRTNLYDGLLSNNFIENMKIARQIKDWQDKYGKWWPSPSIITPARRVENLYHRADASVSTSQDHTEDAEGMAGGSNAESATGAEDAT